MSRLADQRIRGDGAGFHLPGGQVFGQGHGDGCLSTAIRFHLRFVEGRVAEILPNAHHAFITLAFSAAAASAALAARDGFAIVGVEVVRAQDDAERGPNAEGALRIERVQHGRRVGRREGKHGLIHQRQRDFRLRRLARVIFDRHRVRDLFVWPRGLFIRFDTHVQLLLRQIHIQARHADLEIGPRGNICPLDDDNRDIGNGSHVLCNW